MTQQKIRYLTPGNDRNFYYQRKVPKALVPVLKMSRWYIPLGDDFETAKDRITDLKREHNAMIAAAKADPDYATKIRREAEGTQRAKRAKKAEPLQEFMTQVESGIIDCYAARAELAFQQALAEERGPEWKHTTGFLADLKSLREPWVEMTTHSPRETPVSEQEAEAALDKHDDLIPRDVRQRWRSIMVGSTANHRLTRIEPISDSEYCDRLQEHLDTFFTPNNAPTDEEERMEWDLFKMRIERLIAANAQDPDRLSAVFERFLRFNAIRTEDKYRRSFRQFTDEVGDIPISHVTTKMLREYRDQMFNRGVKLASVKAAFSPIKSLFRYACDEEIVDLDPTSAVTFPREKRGISEVKHLPFSPDEMVRILDTIDDRWMHNVRYLSKDRAAALRQAVRAMAFTACRSKEILTLEPGDVTDTAIHIRVSKTESSTRYIPVHPEISDFPAFVRSGGLKCLQTAEKDPVSPVRHNFIRIIRKIMDPPILEPRKSLYSFRATFQDALRRAGAPEDVRKAVLGHSTPGAMSHYDSGPEFDDLTKWVHAADPRTS
ncbi:site-specific recombinase XerD [Aliiruegeria haliotis]|uniref:Site-specific recombinase XerD n=1 Tax=Aliiruegeria haliotis TaxID=1280846 RepID=A0A2T0RUZ9_9RHOB|nr:phage integrase SAM-like domain-containing protein [Aliiruegeria haliotis]PRY24952.1 site-specific recombinase XerD [Aliiruegeria haliotis]